MTDAVSGSLRERLKSGSVFVMTYQSSLSAATAEDIGRAGFDLVFVDCQHGPFDRSDVVDIVAAVHRGGGNVVIRTLNDDQATIGWMLDAGATAVLVPMVSTRAQAERVIAACRYQPVGVRSWGVPMQPTFEKLPPREVDRSVICGVIVETRQGLENVEEIAAVSGIDFILLGAVDLALSLGLPAGDPADWLHGERRAIVDRFLAACRSNDVAPALLIGDPESSREFLKLGYRVLLLAAEGRAAVQALASLRREID
jgi:4-hydroxy-2-oxoheptanedioate aldolase